jgi:peptidoglycan/xylan/chitin deacetylase (PgdA/CDA1 family)
MDENKIAIESVPILMYHYIRTVTDPNDTLGANLSVSPESFSKQLDYLSANNYQTISLQQLRDGFAGTYKIDKTKKPIIITFDDGYDDAYTQAYPILKKHNMIGVFYIISGQIGQSERMTSNQIAEIDKTGMVIGSHSKNHLDLTSISSTQLNSQLLDSKSTLQLLLGHPVFDFCYPAGEYNANDIEALKVDGYLTAATTKTGISNVESNLFELPRIRMQNNTNLEKALSQ